MSKKKCVYLAKYFETISKPQGEKFVQETVRARRKLLGKCRDCGKWDKTQVTPRQAAQCPSFVAKYFETGATTKMATP